MAPHESTRPELDLLYIPYAPRTHATRVAINNHIIRHTKLRKARRLKAVNDSAAQSFLQGDWVDQSQTDLSKLVEPSQETPVERRHEHGHHDLSLNTTRLTPWSQLAQSLQTDASVQDFQYATSVFWPEFDPGGDPMRSPFYTNSWVIAAQHEPILLQSFLWAATLNQAIRTSNSETEYRALFYHQNLIRELREGINNVSRMARDEVILAILSLHPKQHTQTTPLLDTGAGFFPPFVRLQAIDAHTRMRFDESHVTALENLLAVRGGLETIQLPGLQFLLQYADILNSSMKIIRPKLPLCSPYRHFLLQTRRPLDVASNSRGEEELGQRTLRLDESNLSPQMRDIWLELRQYCILMDLHDLQGPPSSSLAQLTMKRNLTQYRLLQCLPSTGLDTALDLPHAILDATFVFALGVTFPIAYKSPLHKFSRRIKLFLSYSSILDKSVDGSDLFLWMCVLGALAARTVGDSSLLSWFTTEMVSLEFMHVAMSRSSVKDSGSVRSWTEIRSVFTDFLWHSGSCDAAAAAVWQEVQNALESKKEVQRLFS